MRSKINCSSIIFLVLFNTTSAQELFTGFIEFKTVSYGKNQKPAGPEKFSIFYSENKAVMKMEGGPEENGRVLVNTVTDSVYMISDEKKQYLPASLYETQDDGPVIIKTDSFRNYFGYPCRGYRVEENNKKVGYLWVNEQLRWTGEEKKYKHAVFSILGDGYIMMCLEMYKNGQREGMYIPVNMQRAQNLPDSIFSINGYNLEKPEEASWGMVPDSLKMAMPPDTTAVSYTPEQLEQAAEIVKKMAEKIEKKPGAKKSPARKPAARKPARKKRR